MSEAPDPAAPPVEAPAAPPPGPAAPAPNSPLGEAPPAGGDTSSAPEGADTATAPSGADTTTSPEGADSLTAASYDFKLPDGVSVDEATMTTLKQTLADAKVPVEVGQSLIDLHLAELNRTAEAFVANQQAEWTKVTDAWKSAIEADPDLGGDKKATVVASIARALDTYGSPEARQAFDLTGAGWNPAIIKFVHKMAQALDEGTPHPASGPGTGKGRTPAQVLYPDNPQA